jgi:hypothetical protein
MEFWEGVFFVSIILIMLFISAKNSSKVRARIKAQANADYDNEIELSTEELESRLGEANLIYEELEQTYWLHISIAIGIASYFYWHVWYLSLGIGLALVFIGDTYLSIKPFKSGMHDR